MKDGSVVTEKSSGLQAGQFVKKYSIYLIFVVLIIAASLMSDKFLTEDNIMNLLSQISIVGILAIGQFLVMLTGGIDLSHGSYVALASVILAIVMQFGLWPAIILSMVMLALLGALNGFFVNKGIAPFIVTLGMLGLARSLALGFSKANTVDVPIPDFQNLAYGLIGIIPIPVILWIVLVAVFAFFLKETVYGRWIYAVGGNEESARLSGIPVKRVKSLVYILSGFLASISGMIYTARIGIALPDKAVGYEMDSITAVIIGGASMFGGRGSTIGTLIGVLIYGVIANLLNIMGVNAYVQQIIKGLLILAAVYFNSRSKAE